LEDYVDIVTVGKMTQVCATLFKSSFKPRVGLISQTFTGASTAIAAGDYIVRQLVSGSYFGYTGANMTLGHYFQAKLSALSSRYPDRVSGPFGIGMMVAFTPYGGDGAKVKQFSLDLFEAGVIGFTAGSAPMRMRFLPPLGAVSVSDIDRVMDIVEKVISRGGDDHVK
jgi:4-aminobutyrate aminotransferase-like enzyme